MSEMTPQQKEQLAEVSPQIKQTLEWMVCDAKERNDQTKPGDYSDELKVGITLLELLEIIVD